MPKLTVYRLTFPGGLHVGARGVNLEESSVSVPSDTLFAALLEAHIRGGGAAEAWFIPGFQDAPHRRCDFALSSAFPFAGEVGFFPMPLAMRGTLSEALLKQRRKDVKRIRFISENLLRRWLAGEPLDDWLFPEEANLEPTQGVALQGGALWLTLAECQALPPALKHDLETHKPITPRALRQHRVYSDSRVPRVTVDRINSASAIYHAGRVSFAQGCGLWLGIAGTVPSGLEGALNTLGEDGLGGERSAGYGAFSYTGAKALELPDVRPGGLGMLLSRYHPQGAELPEALVAEGTAYELATVAGWLRSWEGAAQRRRQLRLVREGSLVHFAGSGPWGDVVDVRPSYGNAAGDFPHPIWRSGLALAAGL